MISIYLFIYFVIINFNRDGIISAYIGFKADENSGKSVP